jgi:hypothetical protein
MGIFTASVFLSTEVGELATTYQVWYKQMAEQNTSVNRPVSMITKGNAHIHLTQMCKRLCESLKAEKAKGTVPQGESRQGISGMANDLDPHNKGNPTKKVRAGITVTREPRRAVSGFSLKHELKISSAAEEERKHNPKVAHKLKDKAVDRKEDFQKTRCHADYNSFFNLKKNLNVCFCAFS